MEKEIHQAVVLIDNDEHFAPIELSKPKVLMNLVDRPMLQYTIDMLTLSNIDEIFLFCGKFFEEIKKFIDDYKRKVYVKLNIQIFFSEDYTSLGPVMRDLYSRGIIKSNFILIHGDCVGNLRLDKMIEKHKENIKKDPGCVMTCIFRKVWPNHRSRSSPNQKTMIALDSQQKIVLFEKSMKKRAEIPTDLFERNSCISIHYDLLDTQIAICSEKVPPDFSDNFDFETRENFIHGLLADIELLCHHIHVEILEEGYAARVDSILAYRNISRDLLQRFVYPIVPNGRVSDINIDDENIECLQLDSDSGHNEEMNENHDDECDSDSTKFSDASDDSYDSLGDEYSAFYNEVYDSVSRGIEEHSIAENIILEINSSKHAYNVPVNEVNSLVIKAVLNLALNSDGNFSSTVKSNLKYGLPIIQNYIKSISSQNDCIYSIEEFQLQNKELVTSLHLIKIIKFLYEENVLEEDLILKWFYKPKSLSDHVTSEQETLRKSKEVGLFIKWLEEGGDLGRR